MTLEEAMLLLWEPEKEPKPFSDEMDEAMGLVRSGMMVLKKTTKTFKDGTRRVTLPDGSVTWYDPEGKEIPAPDATPS